MLKHLSIKDYVIVDQIDLDFMPGFTVLTGETGAGKSILIDALSLTLGERSDASQIKLGCERAEIVATFEIDDLPDLQCWLEENDLQGDPDCCLVRRIIDTNGRSRSYINGHAVTVQQLRTMGEFLLSIHSQHAHQSLLQKDTQRQLLDAFAGCEQLVRSVNQTYRNWQDCRQQRITCEQRTAELHEKKELLEWQRRELAELNLTANEWESLQVTHARLSHAAALMAATESGINVLSEQEHAALTLINSVNHQLHQLLEYDSQLQSITELLDAVQIQLQESVYELRHYQQSIDMDPQLLQDIEQRLATIHAAARKFRVAPDELPQLLQTTSEQLDALDSISDIDHLLQQEKLAHEAYLQQAATLTAERQRAGTALSQQVTVAMQTLAMSGGAFAVTLSPLQQESAMGQEQVEFQVTANSGVPLRPLAKVASGGELSRISLAIQVIASKVSLVPTLVFDEVDVGIGGRVAEIVGGLLKQLGQQRQVLCITHLPQVAAMGDQQWQVTKSSTNNNGQSPCSRIIPLDQQGRVEEIARMLGGVNISDVTRRHAAEMLRCNDREP